MSRIIQTLCLFLSLIAGLAVVAAADEGPIVLRGGTFVTVSGKAVENGTLVIENGRIRTIGREIPPPVGSRVIDTSGCFILPGFFDAFSHLGTAEIDSVEADADEASDPVTPHLQILDSLNPENPLLPWAWRNGITTLALAPAGANLISGRSAVIRPRGSDIVAMTLRVPAALHGCLGEPPKMRFGKKNRYPSTRMGTAALLRQTLIQAREYRDSLAEYERKLARHEKKKGTGEKPDRPAIDLKMEALLPLLRGELPLVLQANRLDDLTTALRIAGEFGLRLVINQGAEAYKIAAELAARKIPVILAPGSAFRDTVETQGQVLDNAARLCAAGVKIAFQSGSVNPMSSLLEAARRAVDQGLAPEDAFRALTLWPAEIYGVERLVGSLEPGKSAGIVVFDTDPLRAPARVKMVFLAGKQMEIQ